MENIQENNMMWLYYWFYEFELDHGINIVIEFFCIDDIEFFDCEYGGISY